MSKLTEDEVLEIRVLAQYVSQADICRRFGITSAAVCNIVNLKSWKHVV